MNRENAERIITEYLKPVFGFALKRSPQHNKKEQAYPDLLDTWEKCEKTKENRVSITQVRYEYSIWCGQ